MFRSVYSVSLCCSLYCLCVNVYWTTATGISAHFWEHPIVAARTLEGAYYTLYGRLREDERKFFNYFRMSTSTFDYILDRLAPHLERQNTMMRESICPRQMIAGTLR
jgi:hypothetical protein